MNKGTCSVVKSSRLTVACCQRGSQSASDDLDMQKRCQSIGIRYCCDLLRGIGPLASGRCSMGYCSLGLESRNRLNAVVARLQPERRVPLAVGVISVEGVSHENAHAQNSKECGDDLAHCRCSRTRIH